MTNRDQVKAALKKAKIPQWKLADFMGIREDCLSRLFRYEIPRDEASKMLLAIEELGKGDF